VDAQLTDLDGDGIIEYPGDDEDIFDATYSGKAQGEEGYDNNLDFNCDLIVDGDDKTLMQTWDGTIFEMTCPIDPVDIAIVLDASCWTDPACSGISHPNQPLSDLAYIKQAAIAMVNAIDPTHRIAVVAMREGAVFVQAFTNNHSAAIGAINAITASGNSIYYHTALDMMIYNFPGVNAEHLIFVGVYAPTFPTTYPGCPGTWPTVAECAAAAAAATLQSMDVNVISVLAPSSVVGNPPAPSMALLTDMSTTGSVYTAALTNLDDTLEDVINDISAQICEGPTPTATPTLTPTAMPTFPPGGGTTPTATPTATAGWGYLPGTPTWTPTVTPTPVAWATVVASKDTYIGRYDQGADHGSEPIIAVAYTNGVEEEVSLIEFDLSHWWQNTGSDIQTAYLRVYAETGNGTISVWRMYRGDWEEDANWIYADPGSLNDWFYPGMQAGRDFGTPYVLQVPITSPGWITIDVTDLVRAAVTQDSFFFGANLRR